VEHHFSEQGFNVRMSSKPAVLVESETVH